MKKVVKRRKVARHARKVKTSSSRHYLTSSRKHSKGRAGHKARRRIRHHTSAQREPDLGVSLVSPMPISHAHQSSVIERVPTGIMHFDPLIEGGFEKNSTNIMVGGPGCGKTIFAVQFLMEGMKRGEKVLYVSFEEKKEQFYLNMLQLGWDLVGYEQRGLFYFLEYTPLKVKTMLEEGGGSIENTVLGKKISRLVIDSMSAFALLFEDELARREAAFSLFNMIRKWNCTSLLTLESEQTGRGESSQALEFEADSIILLYFVRTKQERKHYLEILKMRGTKHSDKIFTFDITKRGIVLSPRPARTVPHLS